MAAPPDTHAHNQDQRSSEECAAGARATGINSADIKTLTDDVRQLKIDRDYLMELWSRYADASTENRFEFKKIVAAIGFYTRMAMSNSNEAGTKRWELLSVSTGAIAGAIAGSIVTVLLGYLVRGHA